jgi:nitroimidazol reductase NimA-like FMN-containing flavoprotein (pyridoxamine 5'-phosphate oxidase superfamily)
MQKSEREITDPKKKDDLIVNGKYVFISMCLKDQPYIVTLSYGYDRKQNALYMHTSHKGLKIDILKKNSKVCATIVNDLGYQVGTCSHHYQSVVLWGNIEIVVDRKEKEHGFEVLFNHLEERPEQIKKKFLNKEETFTNTCILKFKINFLSGKESI